MLKQILLRIFNYILLIFFIGIIIFFLYKIYQSYFSLPYTIENKKYTYTFIPFIKETTAQKIKINKDTSTILRKQIKNKLLDTSSHSAIAYSLTPFKTTIKNKVSINYITVRPLEVDSNVITLDSVDYLPITTSFTISDTNYTTYPSSSIYYYSIIALLIYIIIGKKL